MHCFPPNTPASRRYTQLTLVRCRLHWLLQNEGGNGTLPPLVTIYTAEPLGGLYAQKNRLLWHLTVIIKPFNLIFGFSFNIINKWRYPPLVLGDDIMASSLDSTWEPLSIITGQVADDEPSPLPRRFTMLCRRPAAKQIVLP